MKKKWNLQNPLKRKQLAALLSLALVLLCFVGTTLAYVIAKAGPLTNLFQPVQVSCQVQDDQKQVKNTSDIPVYLRVTVTATYEKDGKIHYENPELTVTPSANCQTVVEGGQTFYYYTAEIAADATVTVFSELTASEKDGYTTKIQVLAEVIQSEPDDAVRDAWEMTFSGTTWSAYTPG